MFSFLQGGLLSVPMPPAMVMQDTEEAPEKAPADPTGSGDGGSGSTVEVGGPIPVLVCL